MSRKNKINSRSKGQRGERQVLKKFEDWWGTEFFRTPGSGSFHTRGYRHETHDLAGDVVTTDATFPFTVECKNAEGWNLENLITAPKCNLYKWWHQAVDETPDDKIPLLVFKRNRHPWLFMMPKTVWDSKNLGAKEVFFFCSDNTRVPVVLGPLSVLLSTDSESWKV